MATGQFIVPFGVDYGGIELKRASQKFTLLSLVLATFVQCIGLATYWGSIWFSETDKSFPVVRIRYTTLDQPPSLQRTIVPPTVTLPQQLSEAVNAMPVPVPDVVVSSEQTIMSQDELSRATTQSSDLNETVNGEIMIDEREVEEEPKEFEFVEKKPVLIKQVDPKYPEVALRAGLEGMVYVKMWVDKEGKVKKVFILKSDSEIFDQSVIDAARQWIYTPALMQQGPVSVWVEVPFIFRLSAK